MTEQKHLTLIEILVVTAVIGLVCVLAAVAVSSARASARDAVRISNIRQMQSALEDYFVVRNAYPLSKDVMALGYGEAGCLTTEGFRTSCDATTEGILARLVPAALSTGLNGLSSCDGAANAYCYFSFDGDEYAIMFELEHAIPLAKLSKGLNCADPEGMREGACSFVGE